MSRDPDGWELYDMNRRPGRTEPRGTSAPRRRQKRLEAEWEAWARRANAIWWLGPRLTNWADPVPAMKRARRAAVSVAKLGIRPRRTKLWGDSAGG